MIPYNYIDLITLDEQNSRLVAGQKFHLGTRAGVATQEQEGGHDPSGGQQHHQIQINSTIDADIVLRRVIEDRAAILALKSREATNEAELLKAKTRQLKIANIIERQDQNIAKLIAKVKREVAEYNEASKQYIRSFMFAFENGDMDKLPRHPFVPPLEDLEQAVNQRKAMLIEKVQADDRVKKLEFINTQERVTTKVMKKNEEAFLRAIEIAKQQFSDSCGTWLNRLNKLLSAVPHHAQRFGDNKKEAQRSTIQAQEKVDENCTLKVRRTQAQASENVFRYPPPEKCYKRALAQAPQAIFKYSYPPPDIGDVLLQRSRRTFAQGVNLIPTDRSVKMPMVKSPPEIPAKRSIGASESMSTGHSRDEMDDALQPLFVWQDSTNKKRQKTEQESPPHPNHATEQIGNGLDLDVLAPICHLQPSPFRSPAAESRNGKKVIDLSDGDSDLPLKEGDVDQKGSEKNSAQSNDASGENMKEEISIAQVLTGLHEDNIKLFTVANI